MYNKSKPYQVTVSQLLTEYKEAVAPTIYAKLKLVRAAITIYWLSADNLESKLCPVLSNYAEKALIEPQFPLSSMHYGAIAADNGFGRGRSAEYYFVPKGQQMYSVKDAKALLSCLKFDCEVTLQTNINQNHAPVQQCQGIGLLKTLVMQQYLLEDMLADIEDMEAIPYYGYPCHEVAKHIQDMHKPHGCHVYKHHDEL